MKLYHRTSHESAAAILAEGFRDGGAFVDTVDGDVVGGVWLSSVPFDPVSLGRTKGDGALLSIEIPDEDLAEWEWSNEGLLADAPREFTVPAEILNRHGPPVVVTGDRL